MKKSSSKTGSLETFTHRFAKFAGSSGGFLCAVATLVLWFIGGVDVDFSNNWQNAIQIYIAVLTFMMIFLIQRSQNRELAVLQVKLDELIVATTDADDALVETEELSENEIRKVHETHRRSAGKPRA